MRIKDFHVFRLSIPMNMRVTHASSSEDETHNLILRVELDGFIGYGECIPRLYVTGETIDSAEKKMIEICRLISKVEFRDFEDIAVCLDKIKTGHTVARCAVELALFDAIGKANRKYIGSYIGPRKRSAIYYNGIIPHAGIVKTAFLASLQIGFKAVKVKVGFKDDVERIAVIRKILGTSDLIADANEAWTLEEAMKIMPSMKIFKAVEQPLKKEDYSGYMKLRRSVSTKLMADESVCSVNDAEKHKRIFDIYNIRISKCGGIVNSLRIAEIAYRNNISVYLGSHVGETGILGAAGRALAFHIRKFTYCEGGYGRHLLKEDIVKEDLTFGRNGVAHPLTGYGLGITVDEDKLRKYSKTYL